MSFSWFVAEFIGTLALVFIGAGSICLNEMTHGSVGIVGIAMAHGLTLAVMISAVGQISGGKINPAVSLGLWIGGKSDGKTAAYEIAAQIAGGIVGAVLLLLVFPQEVTSAAALGTPALAKNITPWMGILAEAILTFFLVFTVYGTAVDPRSSYQGIAGFAIGCVVLFDILAGGALTGAAMNPARAFGPALLSGHLSHQYVYWVGPILGGLAAGLLYSKVMLKGEVSKGSC